MMKQASRLMNTDSAGISAITEKDVLTLIADDFNAPETAIPRKNIVGFSVMG